jgi:hypothetical protein
MEKKMSNKNKEAEAGIVGNGAVQEAIQIEDIQWVKFKNKNVGHGFAAEDANALNDKLRGKKVEKVGKNNELNGPDRIVNGKMIQTK